MSRWYVTVSLPYVNAPPHVGYALELVQADVLVRSLRSAGHSVRFSGGTDDNSLKNVLAARRAGIPIRDFVAERARNFVTLGSLLGVGFDDYIQTSSDPRHRPGVERLWRDVAARGDLYLQRYEGEYCLGCEQFYGEEELVAGRCREHGVLTERVAEVNWFFRLSRFAPALRRAISKGTLLVAPEPYRKEVLAFLEGPVDDLCVSRSAQRAHGWGIPVPDDPGQVVYVWWDALANYVTSLGYGTDDGDLATWWCGSDERVHVVGKGITRFHAVYWPALLLSAGLPLPTRVYVHPYLTSAGRKISKSGEGSLDAGRLLEQLGADAFRWWCVRDVPAASDTDFTPRRVLERANEDLANQIGNLAARVSALRARLGTRREELDEESSEGGGELSRRADELPVVVRRHLEHFRLKEAAEATLRLVADANRFLESCRPWERISRTGIVPGEGASPDADVRVVEDVVAAVASALSSVTPGVASRVLRDETPAYARVGDDLVVTGSGEPRTRDEAAGTCRPLRRGVPT